MDSSHASDAAGSPGQRWVQRSLWCAILLGGLLRLWNAWHTSFWLDDFHSLYHARAENLAQLFQGLLQDNHPPLSFLLLRLSEHSLGAGEWTLHLPNLIVALCSAWLLWRLCAKLEPGRAPKPTLRLGALAFLALSSMHVDLSSNLRMYALLGLCVLGLLGALIDLMERGKGQLQGVLWLVLGLHTHYHFLHASALLFLVSLVLIFGARVYRARLRGLLLTYGIGFGLALPWYLYGFQAQLAHELAPGGSEVSLRQLAMGCLHLLHQGVGDYGSSWRPLFLAGGASALLAALAGQLQLLRSAKQNGRPAAAVFLASGAWLLPLWTASAAALSQRAGFEPRYLVGALTPMALLAGIGCFGLGEQARWPRLLGLAAGALSLSTALALSGLLANSSGHEDYRSASASILQQAAPGDGILAADWQPAFFPHGIGWSYYSQELNPESAARLVSLEHDEHFNLLEPERLDSLARVHCLLRSIPREAALIQKLRSFYGQERTQSFGRGVYVLSFGQP